LAKAAAWAILVLFGSHPVRGQGVYSYTDRTGVRTLTNIPPTVPVRDLELSASAVASVQTAQPPAAPAPQTKSPSRATRYDGLIDKYAAQFEIDPSLIRSMIVQESGYNPRAVSRKGASGLMQLMPETAARLGVRDMFDPEENLRGGTQHMRSLLDMFDNDLNLSLAAYNAGENLVGRIRRVPNIAETRQYVKSITARYGKTTHPPRPAAAAALEAAAAAAAAPLFRYKDGHGIIHLTNIPPVAPQSDTSVASLASSHD